MRLYYNLLFWLSLFNFRQPSLPFQRFLSKKNCDILLQYEILPGSFGDSLPFRVHPISGEITSESVLDYETNKNYEFKIRACLSVNPGTCGYTSVVVIVKDENDNAPRFSASQFHLSLPSDLPVGSDVITLQATDADSGLNGDVNYAINPPTVFGIDYHTGVVQTTAPLTESHYDLTVEAFDHGDPKQIAIARLRIAVHGTNPSAPVFDQKRYDVTLESPIRAGAVVAELHAKDPDPGMEGQITYRFDQSDDQLKQDRKFSINEQTGVVSALTPLTPQDGPFDLVVIAEDQSPVFKRKVSISGAAYRNRWGHFLTLPSTTVYHLHLYRESSRKRQNESQFVMDGDLLRVANHLSSGETHLTIRAESDNAFSDHQLRVVVMFDRDKYPVFPQLTYDIDIPIDSQFPVVVHRFDARLLNGTLRYRFFPDGTAPEGLYIDSRTGELSATASYAQTPANHETQFVVVRAVNVDYPEFYSDVGVRYLFQRRSSRSSPELSMFSNFTSSQVTAKVGEYQAFTKIQLKVKDINEFAPQFDKPQYDVSLSESSAPGSTIVQVKATDADRTDGKHLLYKVVGGSGRDLVFIQEDGTLILGDTPLNREDMNRFDVVVEAIDRSGNKDTTTVVVSVEDVNDNAPMFPWPSFTWNITEGLLRQLVLPLDYELQKTFKLTIEAKDQGVPPHVAITTIIVNVLNTNDNPPVFQRANIEQEVSADLPVGYPILTLTASDADHDRLSYSLTGDPGCSSLAVDPMGIVSFKTPAPKRKPGLITCVVSATDGVFTANATLRLNIFEETPAENHSPRFAKEVYTVTVTPNQRNQVLRKITATDPDGDVLIYSIEPPEFRNLFAVDAEGQLSVRVPISELKQSLYSFLIVAEDRGKPIMSTFTNIRVRVQDNEVTAFSEVHFTRPKYSYAIRSDAQVGTYLGRVTVDNREGVELTFKTTKLFYIDSQGAIRTAVLFSSPMKVEDKIVAIRKGITVAETDFVAHVIAAETTTSPTTQGTISDTEVTLITGTRITSASTEPSTFTAQTAGTQGPVSSAQPTTSNGAFSFSRPMYFAFVPEGQYSNGIRLSVKPEPFSVNRNTAVRYEIDQSAGHIPFFLTADGQLIIFDVDREQQASYSFPIKATSPEYGVATAMVNVTILDVNDNYPVFDAAPSAIGVFSDVAVGTPLFHFTAHDSDADNYGTVVYGIEESDAPFEIDPNGESVLHSLRTSVVFVGTQPGTEIATILAGPTITTKPTQDKILYGLDDDYNGLFAIEDGGRLILARRATAAESDRYIQLNITAENSHGKAWVLVRQPTTPGGSTTPSGCYFPTKVYNAEIMENRQGRIRIAKFNDPGYSDDFELNPTTGEIFAVRPLDREKRSFHFLYVSVSGGIAAGGRRVIQAMSKLTESQTLVAVRVLDENDNAPQFVHVNEDESLAAVVDWQARLFSPVLKLEAKDADERAKLYYSLSGTDQEYFLVNATSGLVILAKTLAEFSGDSLEFRATVTDGVHNTHVPIKVYVISPSSSLVQLTAELPHSQVDQQSVERILNELTGLDNHLLAKQPFVDSVGHADPKRSHLFVYALDRKTKQPIPKEELAKMLESHSATLLSSPTRISDIAMLSPPPVSISTFDIVLAIVCIILFLLLLAACCILSTYCKRKRAVATSDREYMVSGKAGPRPYDVEIISRTTAQRVLSARQLPEIEVAVSPIFMDSTMTTNKSDTTQDFSNSVRERPSLLQSALARQKVSFVFLFKH
ncbi:unnamed protein product [Haemonchus placei]|uniref:Protocadherin Fat 4 n=1 Tax=Haemonchus placei TaxID=6290 RepID=A0A158QQI9_HAEPC|nr:unnamed protein product [Haemonchus placei]